MRCKIVGDTESARVIRAYLAKAGVAVSEKLPKFALHCTIHLSEHSGQNIIVDSIDSPLELHILRHITELTKKDIILRRGTESPAIVSTENEIHISIPTAEPELAHAVEVGVLRGVQRAHFHRPWWKRLLPVTLLCVLLPCIASAQYQTGNTVTRPFAGVPSGSCNSFQFAVDTTNGDFYNCLFSAWHKISSGGGASSFDLLTTGVNVTATMTVGSGATLTFSGSGVNNASQINGVAVSGTPATGQLAIATSPTTAVWADPIVQGTQAAGSTTIPNPFVTGGSDYGGTPAVRAFKVDSAGSGHITIDNASAIMGNCGATTINANLFCGNNTASNGVAPGFVQPTISNISGGTSSAAYTLTGVTSTTQLNGCQQVNATQSFATALAAASNPGCIEVTPGTYTVGTNATIAAGVNLISEAGGVLSIANAVTLTINGALIAPPVPIFAYVGTGKATINGDTPQTEALWFPGANLGVQINNAALALPNGGRVHVPDGSFTVPLGVIAPQTDILVFGEGNATTITFTGASGIAWLFNLGASQGSYSEWATGINNLNLVGPGGVNGLSGNAGTAIQIGDATHPHIGVNLGYVKVSGFTIGLTWGHINGWGTQGNHNVFANNTQDFVWNIASSGETENIEFQHTIFTNFTAGNVNDIQIANTGLADIRFIDCSFDNAPITISAGSANITFTDDHFEQNTAGSNPIMTMSAGRVVIHAPIIQQDTSAQPIAIQQTGGHLDIQDISCYAAATVPAACISTNGSSVLTILHEVIMQTTSDVSGTPAWGYYIGRFNQQTLFFSSVIQSNTSIQSASYNFTETTAPSAATGFDICYGDSTAHLLKCSWNNGTFLNIPQVIASGTSAMTTAAITTGACGTTVTTAATNAATTDAIEIARNAAPTNANGGNLILNWWPTAGNVNFNYCNPSAGSVTPTAMTVNWKVIR